MIQEQWMQKARDNREVLRQFLHYYHPASKLFSSDKKKKMQITAGAAEKACEIVRKDIQSKENKNPVEEFNKALEQNDWRKIDALLNSAWFGVPESRSCWEVTGFKEAVELMEDTPYDPEFEDDFDDFDEN